MIKVEIFTSIEKEATIKVSFSSNKHIYYYTNAKLKKKKKKESAKQEVLTLKVNIYI